MGLNKPSSTTGVSVHNDLTGRTDADGHPMSAISGLVADLSAKATAITTATNTANSAASTAGTANTNATEAETKADDALAKIGTLASLNTTAKTNLVAAINENFTNANNGKVVIASAVNGKGGTANSGMTFTQLADAVTAIPNIDEATGDALAGDVRSGKTFSNAVGNGISGTLAEKQGDNAALTSSVSGTTLKLRAPAGIYDGVDDNVTLTDADFIAANIKNGVNLFGVAGTLLDRKYARITAGTWANNQVTFSCPFKPLMGIGNAHRVTGNYYGLFFFLDSTLDKLDSRFYDGTIYGVGTAQSNFSVGVSISDLGGGQYRISGLSANFAGTDTDQMILHVFG